MRFVGLIGRNITARPLRATLTAAAVAIGVMAVTALGVLTASLKETATQILQVGNADFTISQKNTDDLLASTIDEADIASVGQIPGVGSVVGALIDLNEYDAENPVLIEVGLAADAQKPFGVDILEGRSYAPEATDEVMLGYVFAEKVGKKVGDQITLYDRPFTVTGLYRTNISFGNSTVMMPLTTMQGENRLSGQVTLGFVKDAPGAQKKDVAKAIEEEFPQLTAIESAEEYGRADRNLTLISAANTGGSILALVIAITGVLNTSLLSFFERIREFGVMRSVGWTRKRVLLLVLGETLVVSFVGALAGLGLGWAAINILQNVGSLRGVFDPIYDAWVFGRALLFAFTVAILGALYPAVRAAFLAPMAALRRE